MPDAGADDANVTIVAVDMGYGHLRPAHALATELGVDVLRIDAPPLAASEEVARWSRIRANYELMSRASQLPVVGRPLRGALDAVTRIAPLHPRRDQSAAGWSVRLFHRLVRGGFGGGLVERLKETGSTLLTTFYAPALIADAAGHDRIVCVVTDSDVHRIWAPPHPEQSRIQYCVPSWRLVRRLRAYGVRRESIHLTGFPLPGSLLGGPDLDRAKAILRRRLRRLDPHRIFHDLLAGELDAFLGRESATGPDDPPHLMFAVGGAGAQALLVRQFLPGFVPAIRKRRIRLTLVAGTRPEIARLFETCLSEAGLDPEAQEGVAVLHESDTMRYFERFNEMLADTDILWTKPSELSFYAALGLPIVFSWPVGWQERYNRRWIIEQGAGIEQRDPRHAAEWIFEMLDDGTLAGCAWSGFMRLPCFGLLNVLELVHRWGSGRRPELPSSRRI